MGFPKRLASAKRLAVAFDNYMNYLQNYTKRTDKVGQGEDKPPQVSLYVHPFSMAFNEKLFYKVNGTQARWTSYSGNFTNFTTNASPAADDIVVTSNRFKPARVIIKEGVLSQGARKKSARTDLPYLDYGGKAGSVPFGANLSVDEEFNVFNTIKNKFKVNNNIPANLRISRTKEKL